MIKNVVIIFIYLLFQNICYVVSSEDYLVDFEFNNAYNSEKDFEYYDKLENNEQLINNTEHQNSNSLPISRKLIKTALSKSLTNKALRQKFVEVLPILRVLNAQQKLALSSLISTQISAKPGTELKLSQVRNMFGNNEKLILPLVFDIANLVRSAAKNSLNLHYELFPKSVENYNKHIAARRDFDLSDVEYEQDTHLGEIVDPKIINNELYSSEKDIAVQTHHNETKGFDQIILQRSKRSYELLEHAFSLKPGEDDLSERNRNISEFNEEDHVFNATRPDELGLVQALTNSAFDLFNSSDIGEILPEPESLIAPQRLRKGGNRLVHSPTSKIHKRIPPAVRPRQFMNCERFTPSMCIRTDDYPTEQIMGSIRRHKHAMSALLAEYRDKAAELEYQEYLEDIQINKKRRQDQNGVVPGGMCPSIVRYARPQKARSASGEWKYIVNTGQHTQTLRLEKCSNPQESCSYLSENYRSRCIQVYNYHRLLSWDKNRGLHVDIFKIPTCCSCHVDGYREAFPPLGGTKIKDYPPIKTFNENDYSGLDEDIEYEDDGTIEDEQSIAYQYSNGFKRTKPKFDSENFLQSSSNVKNRYETASQKTQLPALQSYLSPPQYNIEYSAKNFNKKRPSVNSYLESDDDEQDQDSSGSKLGKEVTVNPTSETQYSQNTLVPNRKHISSVSTAKTTKFTPSNIAYTSPSPYLWKNRKGSSIIKPQSTTTTTFQSTSTNTPTNRKRTSLFSTKLTNVKLDGNKRINYNYHPIIDFFEDSSAQASSSPDNAVVKNNFKDSRIGESNWHPLV